MNTIRHVLGYRVFPNVGEAITCRSWEQAISIAEYFRQKVEKEGVRTSLEQVSEGYCIEHGSAVYSRYEPIQSQIVIAAIVGGHSHL